ncbi:RidA family protein [Alginatibacterium sediminis]|uniref:RidA family protein n=1 Tax=Alginatibacterium sediminis TaxID=2164068 RepID=A0A420E7P2_9ALTE|nr:RidA family protein [Alginatibacterium sediminis]RKF14501.1 RidA family protein [Alginatibacterium sediminis]
MIERFETKTRMSRVVRHNGTLYLCGQVAADANQGIKEQTETMLAKVDELLNQYGSNRQSMLSATLYISNMDNFAAMNAVWDAWVPAEHAPARACVQAQMARPELLVEISVTAAQVGVDSMTS